MTEVSFINFPFAVIREVIIDKSSMTSVPGYCSLSSQIFFLSMKLHCGLSLLAKEGVYVTERDSMVFLVLFTPAFC